MNVVEVPTNVRVEVWEYLRLDHTKMRDCSAFLKWAFRRSGGKEGA